MEIVEKIVAILFSMLILLQALWLRKKVGTWLCPGCIFSLFWFFFTFFPLVILFEVPVNALAIAFITLGVCLFSATFSWFNWEFAFEQNRLKPSPREVFATPFLKLTLWASISISLLGSIIHLFAQGFSINEVLSNPILVASKFANARYTDGLVYTVFGPISLLFSNIAVIIGGLIYGSVEAKKNKKIFFAFLPSVVILLSQSSKGLFFQAVFLFLGGIWVTKIFANELQTFYKKGLIKMAFVGLGLVILLVLSFLSRGDVNRISDIGFLFENLRVQFSIYFFGHVYAFSDWFTAYTGGVPTMHYDTTQYYLGFYTFMPLFEFFGYHKFIVDGVFDEYFVYKDLLESNIYTIFRGLIMDFGLLGTLVFMLVNGWLAHFLYHVFLRQQRPVFLVVFVVFMVEAFYISCFISLLTWAIIPISILAVYLLLKFNSYRFVLRTDPPKK